MDVCTCRQLCALMEGLRKNRRVRSDSADLRFVKVSIGRRVFAGIAYHSVREYKDILYTNFNT